jgi:hypothetical protein
LSMESEALASWFVSVCAVGYCHHFLNESEANKLETSEVEYNKIKKPGFYICSVLNHNHILESLTANLKRHQRVNDRNG